jgi:hypothetical protein
MVKGKRKDKDKVTCPKCGELGIQMVSTRKAIKSGGSTKRYMYYYHGNIKYLDPKTDKNKFRTKSCHIGRILTNEEAMVNMGMGETGPKMDKILQKMGRIHLSYKRYGEPHFIVGKPLKENLEILMQYFKERERNSPKTHVTCKNVIRCIDLLLKASIADNDDDAEYNNDYLKIESPIQQQ